MMDVFWCWCSGWGFERVGMDRIFGIWFEWGVGSWVGCILVKGCLYGWLYEWMGGRVDKGTGILHGYDDGHVHTHMNTNQSWTSGTRCYEKNPRSENRGWDMNGNWYGISLLEKKILPNKEKKKKKRKKTVGYGTELNETERNGMEWETRNWMEPWKRRKWNERWKREGDIDKFRGKDISLTCSLGDILTWLLTYIQVSKSIFQHSTS